MKRLIAVLPALAILSACGAADGELTPGNWKDTMTMTKFDIPGAPAEMAEQMKSMLNKPESTEECLTPVNAKAGVRQLASTVQDEGCEVKDYKQGGGKMSGVLVCKGTSGLTTPHLAMTGTYTAEKVEMAMAGEVVDSEMPGGKANIEMTMVSERIGDCKS